MRGGFNLFPIVLGSDGAPWAEATVYLLSRLEGAVAPTMATYSSIADDLAAYRRFLDESKIDWTKFPIHKLSRPTYRYNGHLRLAVQAGDIAASTARRRMGTVVAFYSWLRAERVFTPEHPPWKESDRYIELKDIKGFKVTKQVTTTDVSIKAPKQIDPYAGTIDDGGKLRPLSVDEQGWLVNALLALGNTEMTLIHLLGLLTGARIQTILTFRVGHALLEQPAPPVAELRIPVGFGTSIDTKNDKQMVLHVPVWFYQMLRVYALSDRARKRRMRAEGGDAEEQYLFLSVRGTPLYRSREEALDFNEENALRHAKAGQGVRQFTVERVIPYIREWYDPQFHYRFHDLRASFGMNLTDHQLALVAAGEITLHQAREYVKTRMGHESSAITDRYLQYRDNLKLVRQVGYDYDQHLRMLTQFVLKGVS